MLEIRDLKKSYAEPSGNPLVIIDIPRLDIGAGEQVVLRGESGGGKTTLLHLISGIVTADSGSIKLDGMELNKFSESARDRIRADKMGYRMNYMPNQLSVGQQQRVAVARALANKPRLLLADEPTANVDPANQNRIIELIQEVCREDVVAILLVTHSDEISKRFERVERLEQINLAIATAGAMEL
jgi:ABC-type lipoprotein export system ATPase subunit